MKMKVDLGHVTKMEPLKWIYSTMSMVPLLGQLESLMLCLTLSHFQAILIGITHLLNNRALFNWLSKCWRSQFWQPCPKKCYFDVMKGVDGSPLAFDPIRCSLQC